MTTKGRVVIPAQLRRKYGIEPGTRLVVTDDGEWIILRPIMPEYVHKLRDVAREWGNEGIGRGQVNRKELVRHKPSALISPATCLTVAHSKCLHR